MRAQVAKGLFTYNDYLALDDTNQYELIGGELLLVPAPKTSHQRVSGKLFHILANFVEKHRLGVVLFSPVDVLLSDRDKPQPDLLFITQERINIIKEKYIAGAPDLVVEILSQSTAARDRVAKSRLYYTHGVKEFWIVDPDTGVMEILTPGEKNWLLHGTYHQEETATSPLLGLEINLKKVFSKLVPEKPETE